MDFRTRITIYFTVLGVSLLVTFIGSMIPVSPSYGQLVASQVNQTVSSSGGVVTLATNIAGHNFFLSLFMLIPFVGPFIGMGILYNTGFAISAIGAFRGISGAFLLAAETPLPFFWLEFFSYSAMMSESIALTYAVLKGEGWKELKVAIQVIGIVALALVIGGVIEASLISIGV
ncbi:hypothetical protein HS1genome_2057 [Sulfodiicoccus acidiphilus]|uniref:Stage II sporulation protein M n=1 Tax=Sulfodiicoccus acidiphilus TaxID=1670455 RepID=A0A348B666_9CREN|nr:hypothetical protein [Sulfodiicoccus acidiphilus]BBD73668.1 hypothetical protein HS1genome_2057 [Sulfodiicoccus acidiphilus]GGU01949.1 hypothetical protein GCM10007116_18810 [Sulfodiicoccus acidiphilus]